LFLRPALCLGEDLACLQTEERCQVSLLLADKVADAADQLPSARCGDRSPMAERLGSPLDRVADLRGRAGIDRERGTAVDGRAGFERYAFTEGGVGADDAGGGGTIDEVGEELLGDGHGMTPSQERC